MKYYLTIFSLLLAFQASAQLSVGSNGMTVLAGTSVTVDGLTLTPSASLSIANNSIQKSGTPIAGNPSINRVYQFDSPLPFSGKASITYLPSELNNYTESTLQLAYASEANTNLTVATSSTVNTSTHSVSKLLNDQTLFVVTATALSDLALTLFARPSIVNGKSPFSIVIDVLELNSVATNGSFVVKVTRDRLITLSFNPGLTSLNGRSVNNSVWDFDDSDPDYYILSTSQSIAADGKLSFGLSGTIDPGASSGSLTITTVVQPDTLIETRLSNNIDADKVEYFQQ